MPIAWDGFSARYRSLGRNVAAGVLGGAGEADDVVQEALLALIAAEKRAPDRFRSQEHARNYFLRAVRNLALKRRGSVAHAGLDEDPGAAPAEAPASLDGAPSPDPAERVAALLQELPQAEREFLQQRFLEQCTLAELSARTGIAVSTLYSREKALLERLRKRARGGGEA